MAMAMACGLLGPPELHERRAPSPLSTTSDPFMDLMVAKFNATKISSPSAMGYTENMSATYISSGNPCVDFFFHVVPSTSTESIRERLLAAWNHNPLTTLKLICHLRGVRGMGKSDKEGYYAAAHWLHQVHPKTLACNLASMAHFGYFKDLPEILFRLLEGFDVRKERKREWKMLLKCKLRRKLNQKGRIACSRRRRTRGRSDPIGRRIRTMPDLPREVRVANALKKNEEEKEKASVAKKEKKIASARKAIQRYDSDPDYRFLHERVSDFFATRLKNDLDHVRSGELKKVSLAAKWCPSIDSAFDRATLLCEAIARKVFQKESYPEYDGVEEAHYAYRVRDRLRKEVLVPIRKALELPEVYIGAKKWDSIPYNRVASVAMKLYKEMFLNYDRERFMKYLADVKTGKSTISAGALLPHEIISSLLHEAEEEVREVAELQWKRMVSDMLEKGTLSNCLAISDVSGSMAGTPMEVSVALGVLVSELSGEPWKGKLITFSERPELQKVGGESLVEKTEFVRQMEWGQNTDFQKVFDVILKVAVDGKLKEDQLIKKLFVFSDMEFDEASTNPWETDYRVIEKKFAERGYGSAIPQIVFWNLRDSMATPVPSSQQGVALVSGLSKNLMKLFLSHDDGGALNPEAVMEAAISGEEYQNLAVFD